MSRMKVGAARTAASAKRATALLVAGILLLLAQTDLRAQAPPLQFFKNYFLPGADYRVGGVGLRGLGNNGFATGNLTVGDIPDDAFIAAAFMYWTTYESNDITAAAEVAFFRGQQISGKEIGPGVRVPACSGSGGGAGTTSATTQARVYRADILKNFPLSPAQATLGKPVVEGTHEVRVADSGGGGSQSPSSGNQAIRAEGAAVVIVFQTIEAPLKAVVIYDGVYTVNQDSPIFDLNVGGYYDAADTANAKLTTFVADGRNRPENLSINENPIADTNPFRSAQGSAWDNPEFTVTGTVADTGIPVEMTFPSSSIDCLTWAGIVARVDVRDGDGDGIPDGVEDSVTPLVEPASREFPQGQVHPNYYLMGARSHIPDAFVELGYFKTTTGWGDGSNVTAHDHRPDPQAVEMVARAFKNAGINLHVDVGNALTDSDNHYPAGLSPFSKECATWSLACAIVPDAYARGGESITERGCLPDQVEPCAYPFQKGVVGWKTGYNYFRDGWVNAVTGGELDATQELACFTSGGCTRRRFDEIRRDFWHYSLWAHALGMDGPNPGFTGTHSGFGDLNGGDHVITLHGFGNNWNGAIVTQAGTWLHEFAHNFGLRHSGREALPNCESNYVSVLNYAFQVHGIPMLDANGQQILGVDLSHQVLGTSNAGVFGPLEEDSLRDGMLAVQGGGSPMYGTRWYAPAATSFIHAGLALTPATKRCNGSLKSGTDIEMVRVDGTVSRLQNGTVRGDPVDWQADGDIDIAPLTQDVNYNGGPNTAPPPNGVAKDSPFTGFDDWSYVKQFGLKDVGTRPNMGELSLDVLTADLGRGDPGRGDPGRGDPGRGDPGRGDPGRGDPGRGDPGRGDPGRGDPGAPSEGDQDLDAATGHAHAPHTFRARKLAKTVELTWLRTFVRPQGVEISTSTVYRVEGATITVANFAQRKLIDVIASPITTIIDDKPLNGKPVVYILYEDWTDDPSTPQDDPKRSGFVTVGFTYR
jgi:hypothetical protein